MHDCPECGQACYCHGDIETMGGVMDWHQKLPCRYCGMNFELQSDRIEHERCHVTTEKPLPAPPQEDKK